MLRDTYTGRRIRFRRGVETSLAVQIDHIVALADAWRTGAARWTAGRRLAYANDPRVLIAVDGPANEQKSDDDASQWLPPSRRFRCQYVADQVMVKSTYRLWVTSAENAAMAARAPRLLAAGHSGATRASGRAPRRLRWSRPGSSSLAANAATTSR